MIFYSFREKKKRKKKQETIRMLYIHAHTREIEREKKVLFKMINYNWVEFIYANI